MLEPGVVIYTCNPVLERLRLLDHKLYSRLGCIANFVPKNQKEKKKYSHCLTLSAISMLSPIMLTLSNGYKYTVGSVG